MIPTPFVSLRDISPWQGESASLHTTRSAAVSGFAALRMRPTPCGYFAGLARGPHHGFPWGKLSAVRLTDEGNGKGLCSVLAEAFRTCIHTDNPAIRYSGYIGLLPYVIINARATLPAEDYRLWALTIRQEVVREMGQRSDYWKERYSPFIGAIQDKVYDLFLKGNRVSTGKKNYAEVIQMVMSAGV